MTTAVFKNNGNIFGGARIATILLRSRTWQACDLRPQSPHKEIIMLYKHAIGHDIYKQLDSINERQPQAMGLGSEIRTIRTKGSGNVRTGFAEKEAKHICPGSTISLDNAERRKSGFTRRNETTYVTNARCEYFYGTRCKALTDFPLS